MLRVSLIAVSLLLACGKDDNSGRFTLIPNSALVPPLGQQTFVAANGAAVVANVTWQVKEGPTGGSIDANGKYTAPASTGTFTVVAVEPSSGARGEASVTVSSGTVSHGMAIPVGHPRLWFDANRLARARSWYQANPFSMVMDSSTKDRGAGWADVALRGLLANDATYCANAIQWAISEGPVLNYSGGVACNNCRWFGEQITLVYDWCHWAMTPQQETDFIAATNTWIRGWRDQTTWGHPPMYQNNYYWGYLRNELEWAIASYHENVAFAEATLDFVFTDRLAANFYPSTREGGKSRGGVAYEGSDYGRTMAGYPVVPWESVLLLGRDLFTETDYWREFVYATIYATTPSATQITGLTGTGFHYFPFGDQDPTVYMVTGDHLVCDGMTTFANRWPNDAVGRHARQWLQATGSAANCYRQVKSVDVPNTPLAFTGLPLDYYASGPGYLYGRNAWGPTATHFFFQGKDVDDTTNGHQHGDYGTFQIWRNGRYLLRESTAYVDTIAGYAGVGTIEAALPIGHATILVDGANPGPRWTGGVATVERLESQPGYAYVATDLVPPATALTNWRRELVFVRALETFVVLDRLATPSASSVKTFVSRCETSPTTSGNDGATCTNGSSALVMTTLLPASRSYRVLNEGGRPAQYRIEVDTTPGTAQSYILTVLQAKDATAPSLSPTVTDDGPSYTVTLDSSTRITFQKGMTSAGGGITIGGTTSSFRADVQRVSVTEAGPSWAP